MIYDIVIRFVFLQVLSLCPLIVRPSHRYCDLIVFLTLLVLFAFVSPLPLLLLLNPPLTTSPLPPLLLCLLLVILIIFGGGSLWCWVEGRFEEGLFLMENDFEMRRFLIS